MGPDPVIRELIERELEEDRAIRATVALPIRSDQMLWILELVSSGTQGALCPATSESDPLTTSETDPLV